MRANRQRTMTHSDDPLSSSPDRLRRLADELDEEGQPALAQATRRAAAAAERERREERGEATPQRLADPPAS